MKFGTMLECMNANCRTVILAKNTDGLCCVRCGGRTSPKPFAPMKQQAEHDKSKELTIQVNVDTTGALKGIKEIAEAANECVDTLEKLEKVMGKFANKNDSIEIEFPVLINGRRIDEVIAKEAQLAGDRIVKNI
ncbi:TPA: hypothetical protein ACOFEN_004629 [Bacillus cereus]|uniref:hypothetical protein n=1 Tax=Bacillus cereus TaxID=1396 RepID=UPI000BFDEECE|nr:hypothetical protein [Bacillus cereus]MCB5900285.1 hypothetical protein [Bacillus cereus]PGQ04307.1 hypothetical protein COA09_29025 [Bacillus cereus]PGS61195.1 hypothetical protein COC67_11215 [Bacillus cereus]PGU90760.1 hypothetical protein COD77_30165 [Bacillus cereus]